MGRIKSRFVKSSALKLFRENKDVFTNNFDENKVLIRDKAGFNSRKLRNTVVGYITRVARKKSEEAEND